MRNKTITKKRKAYAVFMKTLMGVSVLLTLLLAAFLVIYVLAKGLPTLSWEFLSTKPSYLTGKIGILPDILNTAYIVLATLLIVLPLGVGAAVYLTEYASNKKVVSVIEYAAETLSGIPSIIYGLVGMLFFCQFLNLQTSLLAGALTLVIMNLPTVMRTTQESLENRSAKLPRGRVRARRGKMARDSHRSFAGLYRRRGDGLYFVGRQNFGRVGGAFVHGGLRACGKRHFCGNDEIRRYLNRCVIFLCQGAGRI